MTVRSANYSSLEEVWGDSFTSSGKTKKEKRKKVVDPICDLYQMGNSSGYNDTDLINYTNNYFEKYDKTPYQRTMNDNIQENVQDDNVMPKRYPRERPVREVTIIDDKQTYDVSSDIDEQEQEQDQDQEESKPKNRYISKPKAKPTEKFLPSRYFHDDDDEPDNSTTNVAFIDLLLYVISGVILIFVMEQFVKIGLLLQ
jgi:hypothetical protein